MGWANVARRRGAAQHGDSAEDFKVANDSMLVVSGILG
jgi:hypothetical protein